MTSLVVPYDPTWVDAFAREAAAIEAAFSPVDIAVHHIGSTAVPGILAKPIIDLMGVVQGLDYAETAAPAMAALGYEAMGEYGIAGRRYFRKADPRGRRSHHVHIYGFGAPHIERHIAFRDYLIAHEDVANAYSDLKRASADTASTTGAQYAKGKARFVERVEGDAIAWYRSIPRK